MNWRTSIAASLVASWLAVTVVGAAEPAQQKAEAKPAAAQSADKSADKSKASEATKKKQNCTSTAASRIRRVSPEGCGPSAPGERSYTAEEISNTGEMEVSDALRKIDPRIQ